MLTLTGSAPLTISYDDGSISVYELDDPILLAAVEAGNPDYGAPEDGVDFATLEWPSDLAADLSGQALSLDEVTARFSSFLVQALHEALERFHGPLPAQP